MIRTFEKTPLGVLDYGFGYSDWLKSGETISTSTWIVDTGLTQDSESETTTATLIWLSGGTVGNTYLVTNKIVTNEGRTTNRSFYVRIVAARGEN